MVGKKGMAEMEWGPLKATPLRLLDFKSRLGYETQQWAALLSSCVPPVPHSQMHPNPLRVPASASPPPLPLLPALQEICVLLASTFWAGGQTHSSGCRCLLPAEPQLSGL